MGSRRLSTAGSFASHDRVASTHAPEEPEIPKEPPFDSSQVSAQPVHHGGLPKNGAECVGVDDLGRYALTEGIGIEELGDEEEEVLPAELVTDPIETEDDQPS